MISMVSLAIRYLFSRKRQSLFTLLGIFLGAGGFVVISGFFLGFRFFFIDNLVNNSAHIFIQARQEFLEPHSLDESFFKNETKHVFWKSIPAGEKDYHRIESPQGWYERLDSDPKIEAYSPQLVVPALFSKGGSPIAAGFTGCLPEKQARVNTVAANMVEGKFSDIGGGGNRIIVGQELLKRLGAKIFENVMVTVGVGKQTPFQIVGTFDSGNKRSDLQAYGPLADVQRANHTLNLINEIDVRLFDYEQSSTKATTWSALSSETIESWDQRNSSIFTMFALQAMMRNIIVFVIMLVAGFGIYNVLMMTVSQKMKDIAILQAMGYESWEIRLLFLFQGFLLGVVGALLGLIAGFFICQYLQTLPFGGRPGATRPPGHLTIELTMGIYLQASLLSMMSALIASYLPARAAAKFTPIEIIRGGAV
ncbi:MAG: FtsX-like permease family protein [Bacteriovoracaceae bacterium]|nr:FtsX-like permease family protein [Bacteriovoracaceae bacterium]